MHGSCLGNVTVSAGAMSSTAGELLKWFIEDGAFHLHPENTHTDQYCDVQHLLTLLEPLDAKVGAPLSDRNHNLLFGSSCIVRGAT